MNSLRLMPQIFRDDSSDFQGLGAISVDLKRLVVDMFSVVVGFRYAPIKAFHLLGIFVIRL